jgi:putative endonuclease
LNATKAEPMKYVYMLQSETYSDRYYTGCTTDLKRRLAEHNRGESTHTKKHLPWKLISYLAFSDAVKANKFEAYLKTASGRAFAKKHF